jgi:catechol-2,3-dioxygenase
MHRVGPSIPVGPRESHPLDMTLTSPHIADLGVNADLPATLRLGAVHLTVADLGRAVAWYERSLGLHGALPRGHRPRL